MIEKPNLDQLLLLPHVVIAEAGNGHVDVTHFEHGEAAHEFAMRLAVDSNPGRITVAAAYRSIESFRRAYSHEAN